MKQHILPLLFLLLSLPAAAESGSAPFQQGCQAYGQGHYDQAIAAWQSLLDGGQESGALYYNLGNAYYRQDDYAHAVLCYERAQRLMPRDRDTRENLALAYSKTEDHVQPMPRFFLASWWQGLLGLFSPRGWMWAALIVLAVTCAALSLFFLSRGFALRKSSFIASIVLGVFTLFSFLCVALSARQVSSHPEAVVMAPMTVAKSSPDQGGVDKFVLHEGTHLRLSDTDGGWTKVYIDDGNSGWLPNGDFETI